MYSSLYIANRFIKLAKDRNGYLTPMQLLKLVYIAHGWSLALNDKKLIAEDVMAWKYGSVIPELYREIKSYKSSKITHEIPIDNDIKIIETDLSLIDEVYSKYRQFTGIELSRITHKKGTPWSKTWKSNPWGAISNRDIDSYYKELASI